MKELTEMLHRVQLLKLLEWKMHIIGARDKIKILQRLPLRQRFQDERHLEFLEFNEWHQTTNL